MLLPELLVVMRSVWFDENIMLYSMQSFHSDYSKVLPRTYYLKKCNRSCSNTKTVLL